MKERIVPAIPKQTISSCEQCRYKKYNGDYGRGYDSGWDCYHSDVQYQCRIVNDNEKKKCGWPNIPNWCPLMEAKK